MKKVDTKEFKELLEKNPPAGGKVILVDFFATWCGPCQMMLPIIEEISNEYHGSEKIEIVEIDIDENPELSSEYSVLSVPTFKFFKNGKEIDSVLGAVSKDILVKKIEEYRKEK